MRVFALILMLSCALLTGCTDSNSIADAFDFSRTSGVSYVCIGMENSARFGVCTGCKLDSMRMNSMFRDRYGYSGVLLQSEQATRANVVTAIKTAVQATPESGLFILYYSGHGGQEQLSNWNTTEPEGSDSMDEYLCLYDTYLLDDELWAMLSACKGRVFCIFDACHSETMFRSVLGDVALNEGFAIPLEASKLVKSSGLRLEPRAIPLDADSLRMLCWSGCMEKEYSFGGSNGGIMTNAILTRWHRNATYKSLWDAVTLEVTRKQPTQHPMSTQYGTGFEEVFR